MRVSQVLLVAVAIGYALLLTGCGDKNDLDPSTINAVCKALVGPIKYNTQKPDSRRHAGDLLGLDLKQRNQIGRELHCPQYR